MPKVTYSFYPSFPNSLKEFVQGQPDVASLFLSARRNYDQLADHIRTTRESVSKELSAAIQELIAMVEQIEKLESSVANNCTMKDEFSV